MTLKVKQLEDKNVQLETKVEEREKILNFILQATEFPVPAGGSKLLPNIRQIQSKFEQMSRTPRTCRELKAMNPSLASGMQWIDPDGQWIGDDPIYVYCDMSSGIKSSNLLKISSFNEKSFNPFLLKGSTSILHDSESPIDVGHCADPGCYS